MQRLAFEGLIAFPDKLAQGHVLVDGERILYAGPKVKLGQDYQPIPVHGYLWPGLIDMHVHGSGGADVLDNEDVSLQQMAHSLARFGVTGFLATTLTVGKEVLAKAMAQIARTKPTVKEGAEILGIHLEGPWVSAQYKGAQNPAFIALPSTSEAEWALQAGQGLVKMVTLAPEQPGALEFIQTMTKSGVLVSLGHSNATWQEVERAADVGASHVTHLFNAMRGLHHREPGLVGAALSDDRFSVELIADGIHVHPAILKMVTQLKPDDLSILVTDAIAATGMPDGEYVLGGLPISKGEGKATLHDGTLAGSILTQPRAIRNMVDLAGIPLWQAVRMASLAPAKRLGLDKDYGSIEQGKLANLVIVDDAFQIQRVYRAGREIYRGLSNENDHR